MRSPVLLILALAFAAPSALAQSALLRRGGDLVAVPVANRSLAAVLDRLLAGPDLAQRAVGIASDLPANLRLVEVSERGGRVALTFDAAFLALLQPEANLEGAMEQLTKTVLRAGPFVAVDVFIEEAGVRRALRDLQRANETGSRRDPPARRGPGASGSATAVSGALSGRTIGISPGHGYYWHSTLGWTTQRGLIDGLIEDIHTNEIAIRYLIPALENMGARVLSCRERGEVVHDRVADNDQGAPTYVETGGWTTSASSGYNGGSYRFATTTASSTATATWTFTLPADGSYPVYVFFRASGNRSADVLYRVHHRGGVTEVRVDQTRDDRRWVHLGDFEFRAGSGAQVEVDNQSATPGAVVIADAVRVGGGLGSIARGAGTSGQARWREAARYWAQFDGAPSTVWDSSSGGQDNSDDVTARPRYIEWRGADAFFSLHTNAGGGTGTSSFIYNGGATAGSSALQTAVHDALVAAIRAEYDAAWVDRGKQQANFGEVRLLSSMPGMLLELAFHDQPGSRDHLALHDPEFRALAGRAIARGVLRYFAPTAAPVPPAPEEFRVAQDGARGLLLAWQPALGASAYAIEQSIEGKGFVEVAQTPSLSWSTGALPHGTVLSFRVRSVNASGRSFPTEVLTAGTSHTRTAELLLVQGFDRFGRAVKFPDNTRDYLRLHGDAVRRAAEFSLGFDAASNEAVSSGRVNLADYRAVDWALGEESTADATFSPVEQSLVRFYLQQGGRLLVSGAEVGWDLDANGSASDRDFFRNVLGATYVADDAGSYAFAASAGGVFAGLASGTFDDGSGGTYDVGFPDVLAPTDARSTLALVYGSGGGAATARIDGDARVLCLGFPLETIDDPDLRGAIMARALRFLLAPRTLEAEATVLLGGVLSLRVERPTEAGLTYQLGAALGLGAIPLPGPGGHVFPLSGADGLLLLSLMPNNGLFVNFQGVLDANGRATGSFVVPNLSFLTGISFYFSGFTVTPFNTIQRVLPWVRAEIR